MTVLLPNDRTTPRVPRWILVALTVLVFAGMALRVAGRDWDESQGLHPDERFMMMVTESLRWPAPGISLFDASRSTLNPNVTGNNLFVYGTLPLFLVTASYRFVGQPLGLNIYQTGRTITAAFDTATLALVAVLGVVLLGGAGALFATAAYAFSVIPIQLSHFYAVDPYASFFCLLAIALALRAAAEGPGRRFLYFVAGFGVAVGCAMASKISSGPIGVVLPLALWIRDRRKHEGPGMLVEDRRGRWKRVLAPTLLAAVAAFVVFRFAQPYAFAGPGVFGLRLNPRWLDNMRDIRRLSVPGTGFPPNIQWWARAPWFPLEQMAFWGMSPLVFLGALAGGLAVAWKNLRQDRWNALGVLWVWCVVNFALFGALAGVKYLRYQLPIYGSACLLFGYAMARLPVSSLAAGIRERLGRPLRVKLLGTGYGVVALSTAAFWAMAFTSIYRAPVTRVEASEWILRHWAGPVNLVIETADGESVLEPVPLRDGIAPERLEIRPHASGLVRAVLFHRVRETGSTPAAPWPKAPPAPAAPPRDLASTEAPPRSLPIRLELSRLEAAEAAAEKTLSLAGELAFKQGVAERVELSTEKEFHVRQGELLSLRFTLGREASRLRFEGTRIAHETGWDDTLPLRVAGWDPYGGIYTPDKLELYDPQLDRIADVLGSTDVISISSNRVYGTITRMSRDFPLVDRFYRSLFRCPAKRTIAQCYREAEPDNTVSPLGYRLEKTFTRHPTVAGISIPDQTAEEAFTVYDHPRVLLFRKETRVPRAEIVRILTTTYR